MVYIHNINKNIAFIGFMGVGKTTFGEMLANHLNLKLIDIDNKIKQITNMEIRDIFENYGEVYFRNLESKICLEISNIPKGYVVSTGGGVIKNHENLINLKKSCIIVFLDATPERIYNNLEGDFSRPLLNNCSNKLLKIKELLSERINLYNNHCDLKVNVNHSNIHNNFNEILHSLKANNFINF